jgi:hypothetical protein
MKMAWNPSKHRFLVLLRDKEGKIDHSMPECARCDKTVLGRGVLLAAHPAEFDGEGNVEYMGDRILECFAMHEKCAQEAELAGLEIEAEWI